MGQGHIKKVIVVGAGPVGLLTALLLGQKGIPVDVLEKNNEVNTAPRGLGYGPSAIQVLERAGVLKKVIEQGFIPTDISWRKPNGDRIIDFEGLPRPTTGLPPFITLPVGSLSTLLLEEVQKQPSVTIHWAHTVSGLGQDEDQAWVEVTQQSTGATKRMKADFLIGCDGGTSNVRKSLFDSSFPGFTWPIKLVAANTFIDFDKIKLSDVQWIIHPTDWVLIARITKQGLWRIVYGETPDSTIEEIRERLPERFRKILPGSPQPDEYQLDVVAPYTIHQRCAERMRVGRVLLAGDAAHLNNPMGGLGLTTGVSDVGSLVDCLYGINSGEASIDILDKYDEIRRQIFKENVNPTSTGNFERIMQDAEGLAEKDQLFQLLTQAKGNPAAAVALMKHEMSIGCDMTQFYGKSV